MNPNKVEDEGVGEAYVPLWCKSNFSFLIGASHPEEYVEQAARFALPAVVLSDVDGMYGAVRAYQRSKELGVKLILGSEITLQGGFSLLILCATRKGYEHLCTLISLGRRRCPKGSAWVTLEECRAHAAGNLALWRGIGSWKNPAKVSPTRIWAIADQVREAFGSAFYAMYARHGAMSESPREARLRQWAAMRKVKMVPVQEVLYHCRERSKLQDVLTAVRWGKTVAKLGKARQANASHALLAPSDFAKCFSDHPEEIQTTLEIAARCHFSLADLDYRYPSEGQQSEEQAMARLSSLCEQGGKERYGQEMGEKERAQLRQELALIAELRYAGYFLTMYEIVSFCREKQILHQGRGSAANSVVCYVLGITAVDPVKMGFLFERFLSRERAEPPDIDLDIEHERREEVIAFVYERYGRDHAAMVANVIRYRLRSAIRDVGKALDFPVVDVDKVARRVSYYEDRIDEASFEAGGLCLKNPKVRLFLQLVREILGFPRHLSIHPGGFLLGQAPVHHIVPIENATMPGRTVIQWDKDDIENLALFKVDLLGLGALTLIRRCFALIAKSRGQSWSLAKIPNDDPQTYEMICRADTIGVFQIESRAQMAMLPRLQPRRYYDLVVEVSIVRPGPIAGGMVHPYLRRKRGLDPVDYPHKCLQPVLEKTLGVPLFQEQVMRLAVVAAGYTPGEADQLRRDMAAWRKTGRIDNHRKRLVAGMLARGIEEEFAQRVFEQIRGFGEYGFPESHAASFAWLAYVTAFLKCHYPVEFVAAILNSQPMGFYSAETLLEDAKRHGVCVRPIDVLQSDWDCSVEPLSDPSQEHGWALRMGLRYVRGLSQSAGEKIVSLARNYREGEGWIEQAKLDQKTLERLARAGALRSVTPTRRDALWDSYVWTQRRRDTLKELWDRGGASQRCSDHRYKASEGDALCPKTSSPEGAMQPFKVLSMAEEIAWDFLASNHSTRGHPLEPFRSELSAAGWPSAEQVRQSRDRSRLHYAGMVICRQRPATASGVTFITLEDETGFVNVVIWAQIFEKYRILIKTAGFLGVSGTLQSTEGCVHVIAQRLWTPKIRRPSEKWQARAQAERRAFNPGPNPNLSPSPNPNPNPSPVRSRDFH